jgi:hypothetical protein
MSIKRMFIYFLLVIFGLLTLSLFTVCEGSEMRQYNISKSHDFWMSNEPLTYVTPNDSSVSILAGQLCIDDDGHINYINQSVPYLANYDGTILQWMQKPFETTYVGDDDLFNHPANGDYWQMPNYYIANGLKGDCEDFSITVVSMMLSGNMTVNGTKQIVNSSVVMGYHGQIRHTWVQYDVNGKTHTIDTIQYKDGYGIISSITVYDRQYRGIYQFTDKAFSLIQ